MMLTSEQSEARRLLSLSLKGVALVTIYAIYGVLQERIMKGHYENPLASNSESFDGKFSSAPFLVLCNRLVSLATGLVLAQFKPTTSDSPLSSSLTTPFGRLPPRLLLWLHRLKPASPFLYYALVAGLNNAATLSQYTSLAYLSFTTATLGKCAKMVPILIFGYFGYNKKYQRREWIGVTVVVAGIWGYLVSLPKVSTNEKDNTTANATNLMGLICLLAYLFFDGQTSLTQERLFGKSKNTQSLLFGLTEPVMDQMIWVNFFSALIALQMLLLSPSSSTASSMQLAMTSPVLQFHIFMLSLTATCGLLLLFHVIATHGALVSGLLMTLRQFVSVVCNALWFGNMTKISSTGWASIGFVAAGVWIKMDRRYDDSHTSEKVLPGLSLKRRGPFWIRQYVVPLVACPLTFVFLTSTLIFITTVGQTTSEVVTGSIVVHPSTELAPKPMQPGTQSIFIDRAPSPFPAMPPANVPLAHPLPVPAHPRPTQAAYGTTSPEDLSRGSPPPGSPPPRFPQPESAPLGNPPPGNVFPARPDIGNTVNVNAPPINERPREPHSDLNATPSLPSPDIDTSQEHQAASPQLKAPIQYYDKKQENVVEHSSESGHSWDDMFVDGVDAVCPPGPVGAVRYNSTVRTAIATYPRSGSSYTRNLIERATGYQTSSLYCDPPFDKYFKAECDGYRNSWVIKTHFPSELKHKNDHDIHWQHFDKYLEIVRNPVDAIWSLRNLLTTFDHSKKLDIKFDRRSHALLLPHLEDYNEFLKYWAKAPIQGLVIRYEDLRRSPAVHLAQIIDYILPEEDLPSPARVACALQLDPKKEMYPSPKIKPFQDWHKHFTPETFDWIIEMTAEPWCTWGYDRLLWEEKGFHGPVNCTTMRHNQRVPIDFTVPGKGFTVPGRDH